MRVRQIENRPMWSCAEIVALLDRYIIGQDDAKRSVAIALRNRWRRMQLPEDLSREVVPHRSNGERWGIPPSRASQFGVNAQKSAGDSCPDSARPLSPRAVTATRGARVSLR